MQTKRWPVLVAWALAAFFLIGAVGNILAPPNVIADYARWGYPGWFHYLTGVLELSVAVLLVRRKTRRAGALLGGLVMTAAAVTLILHAEVTHAIAPTTVLLLLILVGRTASSKS